MRHHISGHHHHLLHCLRPATPVSQSTELLHPSLPQRGAGGDRGDSDRNTGCPRVIAFGPPAQRQRGESDTPGFRRGVRKAGIFISILLGASILIKLLSLADETIAWRHSHAFVHKSRLLSKFRALCESHACHQYAWELQSSVDATRNPCHSLYDYVCGRWRHGGNAVQSVRSVAEGRLMQQAQLSALSLNDSAVTSDATSEKVAGLIRSCIQARRDPSELAAFLRERGVLPYHWNGPQGLLDTLVNLSVKWDIHIWFYLHVVSAYNFIPVVSIRRSQPLDEWTGRFRKTGKTKKYKRHIERVLRTLGLANESLDEAVMRVSSMDALVSQMLQSADAEPDSGALVVDIETMAETYTPAVTAHMWLGALQANEILGLNISRESLVEVQSSRVLRLVNTLFNFGNHMQEYIAEHIAYRVFIDIGWMVDDSYSVVHGRSVQFTTDRITTRCLRQVEKMTGVAWFSLLTTFHKDDHLLSSVLNLAVPPNIAAAITVPSEVSFSEDVLPPLQSSFFADWLTYKKTRHELASAGLYNILRLNGVEAGAWYRDMNLTVEPLVFSYPFFHSQLHPVVNYAGAGRLLARASLGFASPSATTSTAEHRAVAIALHALRNTPVGRGYPSSNIQDELFFMASCYAVCDAGHAARQMCDEPVKRLQSFRTAFTCTLPT
ncbi:hypothetical protein HPB49_009958 [Dermacentor silvarum]|uniref:Uncharacterized protein n=1 Tax=Dermacentor silvarum TaxID=543639 RepID=A0ACB8CEI6_DERSI|nr:hypothetical protein HPB49_009958 [Dermacentor silvarum]